MSSFIFNPTWSVFVAGHTVFHHLLRPVNHGGQNAGRIGILYTSYVGHHGP